MGGAGGLGGSLPLTHGLHVVGDAGAVVVFGLKERVEG